jgi:hypothetical protein
MTFSALFGLRIEATPMFGQPLSERSVFHRSSPVFALATQPTCPDSKEATPETTSNRRGYRADGPFSIPQTHRCSERNPRTSARSKQSFSALAEIRKHVPIFSINYHVDPVRQSIDDTWSHSLDASVARQDWNFSPWYDFAAMMADMRERLGARINARKIGA